MAPQWPSARQLPAAGDAGKRRAGRQRDGRCHAGWRRVAPDGSAVADVARRAAWRGRVASRRRSVEASRRQGVAEGDVATRQATDGIAAAGDVASGGVAAGGDASGGVAAGSIAGAGGIAASRGIAAEGSAVGGITTRGTTMAVSATVACRGG